jgi:uncharacterized membrane protein YgcG
VVRVELSPRGATVLVAAETAAQRVVLDLLRSLSPEQRRRLAAALADLEAVLNEERGRESRAARG